MCRRAARAEKDAPIEGLGDFNAANGTEQFIVVLAAIPFGLVRAPPIAKVQSCGGPH
ncbi:uncharacterized protein TrAFT101_010140 [Trichoderma asperellum]|uniref:uncharacterized protein n=1 Tax=Trichoderma asperellum TaxID=101201 RepID=UPI003329FB33|nr:hypothetical protein TrAFT101_010140 [Trichoderma asperellum]